MHLVCGTPQKLPEHKVQLLGAANAQHAPEFANYDLNAPPHLDNDVTSSFVSPQGGSVWPTAWLPVTPEPNRGLCFVLGPFQRREQQTTRSRALLRYSGLRRIPRAVIGQNNPRFK
jgi:hypothetical protein